jgi:hypothetical protein
VFWWCGFLIKFVVGSVGGEWGDEEKGEQEEENAGLRKERGGE